MCYVRGAAKRLVSLSKLSEWKSGGTQGMEREPGQSLEVLEAMIRTLGFVLAVLSRQGRLISTGRCPSER